MSRWVFALVVAAIVGSCGVRDTDAPRNLDNACSILEQRNGYAAAFRATERKWGVPVHVQMAIIYQESKFKSNARPPFQYRLGVIPMGRQSSAVGYSQALDGSWEEYKEETGRSSANRTNVRHASDFMGWYMNGTKNELGIPLTDTRRQYLAYHDGRAGYRRGTYRSKAWLMRIAGELEQRAARYRVQLANCRAAR